MVRKLTPDLLAVVVAVSLLAHRDDDPAGRALLQVANAGR